ncbi:hypothetical protein J7J13_00310 [bacterium]|nr:hypothetical protein [bacterium]
MPEYVYKFSKKIREFLTVKYHKFISIMAYPYTYQIKFPLNNYKVNGCKFREDHCVYDGVDWGIHLGEDCNKRAGTKIRVVGR